jgi:hypothetical protein
VRVEEDRVSQPRQIEILSCGHIADIYLLIFSGGKTDCVGSLADSLEPSVSHAIVVQGSPQNLDIDARNPKF